METKRLPATRSVTASAVTVLPKRASACNRATARRPHPLPLISVAAAVTIEPPVGYAKRLPPVRLLDEAARGQIASAATRGRTITTAVTEQRRRRPYRTSAARVGVVFVATVVVAAVVVPVVVSVVVVGAVVGGGCVVVATVVGGGVVAVGVVGDGSARAPEAASISSAPAVMPAITPCDRTDGQYDSPASDSRFLALYGR